MKKILIITADQCDDLEVMYPYYRMIEEGYCVDIASFEKTTIKAKYHYEIHSNILISEIDCALYDGLLLPGGAAPEKLRLNEDVLRVIRTFADMHKPIAAICHGQQMLISAGILNGRKATCYPGIKDDLMNAGGVYIDEKVVVEEALITSRRPNDLPFFMKEFLRVLNEN